MFKKGNQFYLEIQIEDQENNLLDISSVEKVQFNIDDLTKTYSNESKEVTYDEEKQCFKIWLTEEETFKFNDYVSIDIRVLYKVGRNDKKGIDGSYITKHYCFDVLKEIDLSA